MISPDQYLEYINSQDICKIKAKITEIKFLKNEFHNCSLSDILLKTDKNIFLKGDMNYKKCIGGGNSFSFENLPKVGDEFYFSVSRKNENYVISAEKDYFGFRIDYDFSKVPVCSDENILKEKWEKGYDFSKFQSEIKFFEEWENYKDFENIPFYPYDFTYQYGWNSHNQIIFERIFGTFGDKYEEINIFELRKDKKIKIPEFNEFKNENLKEKNAKKVFEIYDFVKTGKIGENIKFEENQILQEKYFYKENLEQYIKEKNNFYLFLGIIFILLFILFIFLKKIFKFSKNK